MYNEGGKKLDVYTPDGRNKRTTTFQVAWVKQAFGSVSLAVQDDNRVVFEQEEQDTREVFVEEGDLDLLVAAPCRRRRLVDIQRQGP